MTYWLWLGFQPRLRSQDGENQKGGGYGIGNLCRNVWRGSSTGTFGRRITGEESGVTQERAILQCDSEHRTDLTGRKILGRKGRGREAENNNFKAKEKML